jgi:hypothetical protein
VSTTPSLQTTSQVSSIVVTRLKTTWQSPQSRTRTAANLRPYILKVLKREHPFHSRRRLHQLRVKPKLQRIGHSTQSQYCHTASLSADSVNLAILRPSRLGPIAFPTTIRLYPALFLLCHPRPYRTLEKARPRYLTSLQRQPVLLKRIPTIWIAGHPHQSQR